MSPINGVSSSPDDKKYADLKVISYHGLFNGEADTLSRLHSACTEDGFFYLDLSTPDQQSLRDLVAQLIDASGRFFSRLPLEEKMLYDTDVLGSLKNYGYKPSGRNSGVVNGKQDGHEMFLMPRDALMKLGSDPPSRPQYPPKLERDLPLLEKFTMACNCIGLIILGCLAETVDCDRLRWNHDPTKPSTSATGLLYYSAQPHNAGKSGGHVAHTDVGSLSVLFSYQEGLQVSRSGGNDADAEWLYIKPQLGYAVVNVGDCLRHMSGHKLKSSYHRVVPQKEARASVIYFLRPQMDAAFTDKKGKEWTSIDYHKMKYNAFRHDKAEEVQDILKGDC